MLRAGVQRIVALREDWNLCGESDSASGMVEVIGGLAPDLVLLDISLPDKSGLELIKDLQAYSPGTPILVFSMHDEMIYAERVIRAGAKGYVVKGASTDTLLEAIDRVLAGGIYLSARVSEQILRGLSSGRGSEQLGIDRLTDRELEVFELIGRGRSSAQIADLLHISQKTVDAHRANMRTKLSVPDGPTLIREAVLWVEFGPSHSKAPDPAP